MSTVEEVSDTWGSFDIQLDPDTPSFIYYLTNPQIHPTTLLRIYPFEITKDQIEEGIVEPLYSGVIRSSTSGDQGRSLGGCDGSYFLGETGGGIDPVSFQLSSVPRGPMSIDPVDAINFYGSITGDPDNIYQGLLEDWVNAILTKSKSGVEAGFVGGPTTQKVSGYTLAYPPRVLLDTFIKRWFADVMWRMGPDLKLYVGYQHELWPTPDPAPLAVRKGVNSVSFLPVTVTSAGFDIDMDNWITGARVWENVTFPGATWVYLASPNAGAAFNPSGDPLVWEYLENSSDGTDRVNADEVASDIVTEANDVTSYTLSVDRYSITQRVRPGGKIFVWDPIAGFYDFTDAARTFNGEPIFPIEMDVSAVSWPIVRGMGVWLDMRHAGGGLHDITRYVERDQVDTSSTVTIGKKPPVIGVGKRRYQAGGLQQVNVQNPPPNPPNAEDNAFNVDYETPYSGNVLIGDTGTDELELDSHTDPLHGDLVIDGDGEFVYTPEPEYVGSDSFTYTVKDEWGREDTATVAFNVLYPPEPVAGGGTWNAISGGPDLVVSAASGVLSTDFGTGITVIDHDDAVHGIFAMLADGSFTYTPPAYGVIESIGYTIQDIFGRTADGSISILVA